ncbi:ATP-dependent helicase [Butyrivibrio sp. INlla14]|uniref:ATP-dependent helicase n=1 Tax=Butyrivibrio sp. INlla14 TaxID=1520808 RepID=UPI000876CCE9|nr:ATP-dependent helicase [Butyrivibrio sp. INlla14]SCX97993.1 DNA helicase-2 / ATP-dependent DNA helicase PcrA [Butyrivibrio sp. INlla14]
MTDKDFFTKYGQSLNDQQLEAVQTVEGPVLLLAVPGSGKTTVLVNRLGYMLYCKKIAPEHILTLTYTVAATRDMASRFEKLFGGEFSGRLEFRTINGICAKIIAHYGRLIGKSSFELVTDEKITGKILTDIYLKVVKEYPTESDIKAIRTLITYCKNMCLTEKEIKELGKEQGIDLNKIYELYNNELKLRSLMDYDDQMIYAYRMLKGSKDLLSYYQNEYRYICVDEAQDTSKIQHMIIALLAGKDGNLFMVGDEDQSIYGFRAAYPDALLNFEKEHPGAKVLVMDKNYRSNAKIVQAADYFIQNNKSRHEKHMCATKAPESDIRLVSMSSREAQYSYLLKVAQDVDCQTAVLYRDNESALPLVDILEREGISYRIKSADMGFFTHRVVVDVTNMLEFALRPADPELFMKIYFKFQTYLRKPEAESMCYIADNSHCGILDAAEQIDINKRVLGNLRSLRTHFKNMATESPYKAINRLDKFMGYGEYLKTNNIDTNKLFILKMLAKKEDSIKSFLDRLEELRLIISEKEPDYGAKFILSTIHSSKGLEYDNVILMDVVNGVFPSKAIKKTEKASPQDIRDFEEERRIFYVGMTRAKDRLTIFKYDDKGSTFVKELTSKDKKTSVTQKPKNQPKIAASPLFVKPEAKRAASGNVPKQLIIGERIIQDKYGAGVIADVSYDDDEIPTKFTVEFDSGKEKIFVYPFAFITGMKILEES